MTNCYIDFYQYRRSPSGLESDSLLGNAMRLSALTSAGATSLPVTPATTQDLHQYDQVTIFDGPNSEVVQVNIDSNMPIASIPLVAGTQFQHAAGTPCCSDGPLGSLADQIVDASAWLEADFTYQPLFQATYTNEVLPLPTMRASITNKNALLFRPMHFPVTALLSVSLQQQQGNATPIDITQAFIDATQQYVKIPVINATGTQSQVIFPQLPMDRTADQWITISYTAGFTQAQLPPDIRDVAVLLTSVILSRRQNPTGADSIDFADKKLVATLRGDNTGEGLLVKEARRKASRYKVKAI